MVQNEHKLGRPTEFERDDALAAVLELFWDKGFKAVSISNLESATGLNRSSLYNTFGSKSELFKLSIDYYVERYSLASLEGLRNGSQGIADLEKYFNTMSMYIVKLLGKGCFMVNSMAAMNSAQPNIKAHVKKHVVGFLDAIRQTLRRAADRGEISAETIDQKAATILSMVIGVNLLVRSRQDIQVIKDVLGSIMPIVKM
jgi:AcrR family transcriptional regulator